MPTATLSEENVAAIGGGPHRERALSSASAKSIDKALAKLGGESMAAAQTSVVLGEKNRDGDPNKQASAIKALEKTGTHKSMAALNADTKEKAPGGGGGCCLVM